MSGPSGAAGRRPVDRSREFAHPQRFNDGAVARHDWNIQSPAGWDPGNRRRKSPGYLRLLYIFGWDFEEVAGAGEGNPMRVVFLSYSMCLGRSPVLWPPIKSRESLAAMGLPRTGNHHFDANFDPSRNLSPISKPSISKTIKCDVLRLPPVPVGAGGRRTSRSRSG